MKALYKRIITIGMICFAAVLAWVYCMLEYRDKPIYIIVISLVVIVAAYALLNAYISLKTERDTKLQNYINETVQNSISELGVSDSDEMERLNKATYVQIRKTNTILSQLAEDGNKNSQQSLDSYERINQEMNTLVSESITKAVKVIVKYNQNNNGNVVETVNALSKGLDNIVLEINQIKSEISNLELSAPAAPAIPSQPTRVLVKTVEDIAASQPEEDVPDMNAFFSEFGDDSNSAPEAETISETIDAVPVAEPATEPAQPTVTPVDDDPNKMLSPDDIAALFASANSEPASEPTPEPEVVQPTVTPVSDDPNKMLSPDDIAALFASANSEPASEPTPEPEVVQPTVTPVSDDPNKQLSPDEIAALFASMNG